MKKRELKGIAKAIVQNERVISNPSSTKEERQKAMAEIMKLSSKLHSLEDMTAVDELAQAMLSEGSWKIQNFLI